MSELQVLSTEEDARATLRILAAYGGRTPEITDDMVKLWTTKLSRYEPLVLGRAARQWAGSMSRFPTLAEFGDEVRGTKTRYEQELRPRLMSGEDLTESVLTPTEQAAKFRELREQIKQAEGPLFKGVEEKVV